MNSPDGSVVMAAAARPAVQRNRDGFLDTIRAIATVRVVLWHAFGTPFLSFLVASMPTMFFVAGSLFAASYERKPFTVLLRDRLRRILIPTWVFGACAMTAMAIARLRVGGESTRLSFTKVIGWMLPLVDPKGSAWEGGWLSNPLWYLRALIWLMLATPVLRWALRRLGALAFVPPVLAVLVIDQLIRRPALAIPGFTTWRWYAGDLALYSIFWMLGFLHRSGRFAGLTAQAQLEWAVIFGVGAAIWCTTQPMIGGVVNNSYPGHLLVGSAWLFVFLLLEPVLAPTPNRRLVGPVVRWLTRRSMTVYLWHTTAIVCADTVLRVVAPSATRLLVIPLVIMIIPAFVVLFGWVEDFAAGRTGSWWPLPVRLPALAHGAAALLMRPINARRRAGHAGGQRRSGLVRRVRVVRARSAAGFGAMWMAAMAMINLVPSSAVVGAAVAPGEVSASGSTGSAGSATKESGARKAPAPSARPETAVFALTDTTIAAPVSPVAQSETSTADSGSSAASAGSAPTTLRSTPVSGSAPVAGSSTSTSTHAVAYQAVLDAWLTEMKTQGAAVTVVDGQAVWNGAGGTMKPDQIIEVTSATKSFTAAAILRLVDQGKLQLDAPIPALAAVPEFPLDKGITPRQLLNHTSGLATYQDSPEYAANPGMQLTPQLAVKLAATQPLLWEPGTNSGYSSSGYLTLGLIAEQVSGKPLKQLFDEEFFTPLHLDHTELDALPPVDGWIGWSTGGITTDMNDLATWGSALLRDKRVLSPDSTAAMLDISNNWSVGLGAWPVCPCSLDAAGAKVYTSIGHNGGSGTFQYSPADGLVIAAFLSEPIFNGRITQQDLYELLQRLRAVRADGAR